MLEAKNATENSAGVPAKAKSIKSNKQLKPAIQSDSKAAKLKTAEH